MSILNNDNSPLIHTAGHSFGTVTDRIADIPLGRLSYRWLMLITALLAVTMMMLTALAWVVLYGVGVWGINVPVAWGFAIVNFVWWIGIGHAGTFISAILLLLRQRWRNSINRLAEAMTLFAVANAGLFPLLHLGRIQRFYYLMPYPDTLGLWPQWRSPLVWDVFAVMTYGLVSLLFWYVGLIPDLATIRDKATRPRIARLAGIFAFGWRGEARQWHRHQTLYLMLAGLATPLVISVHTIVSLDFSIAIVPGWHSTIFPPYFVAGAIFSGFAMVATIAIPLRRIYNLYDFITKRHLDLMAKVILVTSLIVAYGYLMEHFTAFFSGDEYEIYMTTNRMFGPYALVYWMTILCNVLVPQLLWMKYFRQNPILLFVICQFVNVGMWTERYMIVIVSLHRDYLPSSWDMFHGTMWDWMLYIGTIGFFILLVALFVRILPVISIYEMRELLHDEHHGKPIPAAAQETVHEAELEDKLLFPITDDELYGIVAEFDDPARFIAATRAVRKAGYSRIIAYSPLPLHELSEAMQLRRSRIPLAMLVGGLLGGIGIFCLQYYAAVIDYPWNVGGRPNFSWPSFIPLTFELTVLGGALFGVIGFFLFNGSLRYYHSVSNTPNFDRASRDRFFLGIEKRKEANFDRHAVTAFLHALEPLRVSEVPR